MKCPTYLPLVHWRACTPALVASLSKSWARVWKTPWNTPFSSLPVHGLEVAIPVDESTATYAPINAGDAVIHLSRTLHAAGVNTTAEPRRAYILGFSVKT